MSKARRKGTAFEVETVAELNKRLYSGEIERNFKDMHDTEGFGHDIITPHLLIQCKHYGKSWPSLDALYKIKPLKDMYRIPVLFSKRSNKHRRANSKLIAMKSVDVMRVSMLTGRIVKITHTVASKGSRNRWPTQNYVYSKHDSNCTEPQGVALVNSGLGVTAMLMLPDSWFAFIGEYIEQLDKLGSSGAAG